MLNVYRVGNPSIGEKYIIATNIIEAITIFNSREVDALQVLIEEELEGLDDDGETSDGMTEEEIRSWTAEPATKAELHICDGDFV